MVFPSSSSGSSLPSVSRGSSSPYSAIKRRSRGAKESGVNTAYSGYSSARLVAARHQAAKHRTQVGPQSAADAGKLTVVLDLDECLVHSRLSSDQEAYRHEEERKSDPKALDEFVFQLEDGEVVRCNKRPGLQSFLEAASKEYEIMAYTAGIESYAGPLLDHLDPRGTIFRYRLYRDSCIYAGGIYTKDLARFNRPMNRIVLVDNNALCFLPQLGNGVPISAFYDDQNDTALTVLASFLARIKNEPDVRPFLRKSFNLETLLAEHREQILG